VKVPKASRLRPELTPKYKALVEAEDALTEVPCAPEVARLERALSRYTVRVLKPESFKEAV
jgi:hypothetical protein